MDENRLECETFHILTPYPALPYLAMAYLYKKSNRFWHLLIRHRLVHAVRSRWWNCREFNKCISVDGYRCEKWRGRRRAELQRQVRAFFDNGSP